MNDPQTSLEASLASRMKCLEYNSDKEEAMHYLCSQFPSAAYS